MPNPSHCLCSPMPSCCHCPHRHHSPLCPELKQEQSSVTLWHRGDRGRAFPVQSKRNRRRFVASHCTDRTVSATAGNDALQLQEEATLSYLSHTLLHSVSLLLCPWSHQMARDVPADAIKLPRSAPPQTYLVQSGRQMDGPPCCQHRWQWETCVARFATNGNCMQLCYLQLLSVQIQPTDCTELTVHILSDKYRSSLPELRSACGH